MKPRERVLMALNREEADRCPMQISFTPEFADRLRGDMKIRRKQIHNPHGGGNTYELERALGQDMLLTSVGWANSYYMDDKPYVDEWGIGWDVQAYDTPYGVGHYTEMVVHPLADDAAISSYQPPDPQRPELYEDAARTVADFKEDYWIVGVTVTTILETAWALRGLEQMLLDMALNEGLANHLLDIPYHYHLTAAKKLAELGVDMIWTGDDIGAQHEMMISPRMWRKYLKPRMANFISELKAINPDVKIAYHSDGNIKRIIPELIEIGLDVLNPIQPASMDPVQIKKEFGDQLCFWGSIDEQHTLPFGTAADVEAEVLQRLETIGRGGGLILAPTHHVQLDTPMENFWTMVDTITGTPYNGSVYGAPMENSKQTWWKVEIEGMANFDMSMQRVYAWYENEIIDRPPVRFVAHNEFLEAAKEDISQLSPAEKKAWWFDVETQVELFVQSIAGRNFHGETFPVFFPNLGPDVYAAFYGAELEFGEVTSWSVPLVREWDDIEKLVFDRDNVYFRKLEELTEYALQRCTGKFLVGYTDLHPGLDCVAAWRDPQQLCFDMIDSPHKVEELAKLAIADFEDIYNHFDAMLKAHDQLSVSWMGIPSFGRMHIPSCDFSTMISPAFFNEYGLPILRQEVQTMSHNIFHVDGKGVARHLDSILSVPQVHAVQWVQGVGDDLPIMQWIPFLKELQARGVPVIVDLNKHELDAFLAEMKPQGLFLWIATENEEEEIEILRTVSGWV